MRKLLTLLAAISIAVVAFAGPAAAQYGPGDGVLGVDDSNPDPGQTITVTGQDCERDENVVVELDGETYETVADEDGNFILELTAPSENGTYTITASCGGEVTITVGSTGAAGTVTAATTLPRTGGDSLPLASIGAVLVALGGLAVLVTRKRASASV